jgi:hypothetical protein
MLLHTDYFGQCQDPKSFVSQLTRTSEQKAAFEAASAALIAFLISPASLTPFCQKFRGAKSSEQLVDDGSDCEGQDDYNGDID